MLFFFLWILQEEYSLQTTFTVDRLKTILQVIIYVSIDPRSQLQGSPNSQPYMIFTKLLPWLVSFYRCWKVFYFFSTVQNYLWVVKYSSWDWSDTLSTYNYQESKVDPKSKPESVGQPNELSLCQRSWWKII